MPVVPRASTSAWFQKAGTHQPLAAGPVDHLHAAVAIAAMKQGKHVMMHKPLANRLLEARWVIEWARKTKVATHFLAASDGADIQEIKRWIDGGAIGNAIDRLAYGAVFDFAHIHVGSFNWYVFNLADAAIVLGVPCLLYPEPQRR